MAQYGGTASHQGFGDRGRGGSPSWQAAMMRAPGFQRLSMDNLRRVFQLMKPMPVREGQVIIRQDAPEDDFYVIAEGRCEVLRSFKPGAEPTKIAELAIGDTLGEDSLVSHTPHNSTVRMLTSGVLMRLDADDFRSLIKRAMSHPVTPLEAAGERNGQVLPGAFAMPHVIARSLPFKGSNYQRFIVACSKGFDAPAVAFALCKHGYDAFWLKGGLDLLAKVPDPLDMPLQWQPA
jgi:rhodanese-related sulfurtransferase